MHSLNEQSCASIIESRQRTIGTGKAMDMWKLCLLVHLEIPEDRIQGNGESSIDRGLRLKAGIILIIYQYNDIIRIH